MRKLHALINSQRVGELCDDQGVWSFTYAQEWLSAAGGYAISPALPLQVEPLVDNSTQRSIQWFFDNLLPEEAARTLLAKDAKLDASDAFALLAYYGAESAGSLVLLETPDELQPQGERPLSYADLHARVKQLPRASLFAQAPKRMSLAGAQHKLPVIYRDGLLFEPIGSTPSTHILKPNHSDVDYAHSAINEYFTMRLAHALKLVVPSVSRLYTPEPIYLIERFDRVQQGNQVRRRHAIDACQLLNRDRQFKYRAASLENLAVLASLCSVPATARLRLFSWLVFNLLTGNSDMHLKNLSFLVEPDGIQLAPHYDLLAIGVYDTPAMDKRHWPATSLAWPLLGRQTFGEVNRALLLEAGHSLGIGQKTIIRLLDFQVEQLLTCADDLLGEIEQENKKFLAEHKDLTFCLAGEMRCLRAIVHLVMKDMVHQLSK